MVELDFCVVCHLPLKRERNSTIRWYYASAMKDPRYNKLPGYVHSTCFNADYDDRARGKVKPPTDPNQTKLF